MKTKDAVAAIIMTDGDLTPAQRVMIMDAIERIVSGGTFGPADETDRARVIRWGDAARRLGVTKMTVRNLAGRGELTPVQFGRGRALGVTFESIEGFIRRGSVTGARAAART